MQFIMTAGVPGSGKTFYKDKEVAKMIEQGQTFIKCSEISSGEQKSQRPFTVISMDEIRRELTGDINDQTQNALVFDKARKYILEALKNNIDVIYDATNVYAKSRKEMAEIAKSFKAKTKLIVCAPSLATSMQQVKSRAQISDQYVPEEIIERMQKRFQMPSRREGWDEIAWHGDRMIDRERFQSAVLSLSKGLTCSHGISYALPYRR